MSAWRYRRGSWDNGLAAIIWIIAVIAAFFLILHIIFVLFEANPGNALVDFVGDVANALPGSSVTCYAGRQKLAVFLNFGLAAIIYLALGRIVARAID
jgi:hypothetical protein